jgi:hypothetical protein
MSSRNRKPQSRIARRTPLSLLACLAGGLLPSSQAAACPPCDCAVDARVFPEYSSSLPQNAVFFVWAPGRTTAAIEVVARADGAITAVETAVTRSDVPDVFEVRPLDLLEPGGHYALQIVNDELGSYTVLAGSDEMPPTFSDAVAVKARDALLGTCGRKRGAAIRVSNPADDRSAQPWLARLEFENGEPPLLVASGLDGVFGFGKQLERGTYADCMGNTELGARAIKSSFTARISLLDHAGNASESRAVGLRLADVEAPDCGDAGGCSVLRMRRAGQAGWLASALATLLVAARARRRRPAGDRLRMSAASVRRHRPHDFSGSGFDPSCSRTREGPPVTAHRLDRELQLSPRRVRRAVPRTWDGSPQCERTLRM